MRRRAACRTRYWESIWIRERRLRFFFAPISPIWASQEATRIRIADETQTAALEAQERSVVLQARIALSISFLVIVGLVGFMLIRREAVTMESFINVGVVAFLICAGWILVTLGAWEWLQGYMAVAF